MIDTNLLHRRINYRQFKKDVIPPKETIESIIKEAISVTPFKGSFKQASIDVYGANQTELKHNLMLTSSTEQSGTLRHQNYDLTDEQWEIKIKDYYSKHPEEFNTQIEAPYLIAVVENLDYYNYSETNSKEEIVTKNAMHNRLANAARHGALGYGLSLAANRHEVDACFCGCYNRKTEHRFNKLLRDYIDTNRSVLFLIGMGYYLSLIHI